MLKRIAVDLCVLTNGRVMPKIPEHNLSTQQQNCWGFTAEAVGWMKGRAWLGPRRMEEYLKKYTVVIRKHEVRPGDLAVYRLNEAGCSFFGNCVGHLWHTAIIVKPDALVLHKPGSLPIVLEPFEICFLDAADVTFHRVTEERPEEKEPLRLIINQ